MRTRVFGMPRFLLLALALLLAVGALPFTGLFDGEPDPVAEAGPPTRVRELVDRRSAVQRVFELSNGQFEAEVSARPRHYRDGDTWRDIDTAVREHDADGFAYANTDNAFHTAFGEDSGRMARFALGHTRVDLGIDGPQRTLDPEADGDTVTYPDAFDGADLRYQVTGEALKEEIVLHRAPADPTYRFTVAAEGVTARAQDDGSIGFFAGDGPPLYVMPAPFMHDSADDPKSPHGKAWSDKVTQTVEQDGDRVTVVVRADKDWLHDPARAYPVVIDPTIRVDPTSTGGQDVQIWSDTPDRNDGASYRLSVGTDPWGRARALVRFDTSVVPAGTTLASAKLRLYYDNELHTDAGDIAVEARRITGPWAEDSATWNTIHSAFAEAGLSTAVRRAGVAGVWHELDVRNIAQSWVSGSAANHGVMVKAVDESTLGRGGAVYLGAEGDYNGDAPTNPQLVLTYGRPGVALHPIAKTYATGAELTWSPYPDPDPANPADDLVEYQVHRSAAQVFTPSSATLVGTVGSSVTRFTDTTAAPTPADRPDLQWNAYHYMVVAKSRDGQLVPGATQLARTPKAGLVTQLFRATADTTIAANLPTANHNQVAGQPWLMVGNNSGTYGKSRALVRYDLSAIPPGTEVVDADLSIWGFYTYGSGAVFDGHPLTRPFTESQATWNQAATGVPWTAPGGDAAAAADHVIGIQDRPTWHIWENAAMAQAWVDNPAANHGFMVKVRDEAGAGQRVLLHSDEAGEPMLRPNLAVTYRMPAPIPTAPQVVSYDYPADGQPHGGPDEPGTFTFKTAGAVPIAGFRWQLNGGATTDVAATGKVLVAVTPTTAGPHTLTVRSYTAEGAVSAPTTYEFVVATPPAPIPDAPRVSSVDYPTEGEHGGPGREGVFTFQPTGTVPVTGYRWRFGDGPTTDVPGTGRVDTRIAPPSAGAQTLTVWAFNADGALSQPTEYTFTVADAPVGVPDAPQVSSVDYPADGQPHGSLGQAGVFTFRAVGSLPPDVFRYQLDTDAAPTEVAVADGTATATLIPVRSGKRTLTVWAKITGTGALSAPTTHTFVVGTPAGGREYHYDAAGQLAGVTTDTGEAAAFHYDDAGNLLRTDRYATATPSVFAVVPARGPVGARVEISGTGFSTTPAENAVAFDGIAATVTSATASRITAVVPAGTTDGAVTVTTRGTTASAPRPFLVSAATSAPTITAISTDRGTRDELVTITGTGFDPDKTRDIVLFHRTVAQVQSASPTSITVRIPEAASSGKITVRTPGGVAESAGTFLVAPRGFAMSGLVYGGTISAGSPAVDVAVPAGKSALVLVEGIAGERVNVTLDNNTIPVRSAMWMFTPYGGNFARQALGDPLDLWAGGRLSQDLPAFPTTGTYALVLEPNDDGAGSVRMSASHDLTGSRLTKDGAGVGFQITELGQTVEFPFTANQGEWLSLGLTEMSEPNNYYNVRVYHPDGSYNTWSSRPSVHTPTMVFRTKQAGEHKVTVSFDSTELGFARLWLSGVIDGEPLVVDGPGTPIRIQRPGQSVRLPFQGTAGQVLGLGYTENTLAQNDRPAFPSAIMSEPDDVQVEVRTGWAETRDVPTLRKTGAHNLFVTGWQAVGTVKVWLSTGVQGGVIATNSVKDVTVERPGQDVWLDYDGVAGRPLFLTTTDRAISGEVSIQVYRPDGVRIGLRNRTVDIPTLPTTGRYRVQVDPETPGTGALGVVAAEPRDVGELVAGATPTDLTLDLPGQRVVGRFTGTAGERLSLGTSPSSFANVRVKVIKPDGANLENLTIDTRFGIDLPALPVTGEYRVEITPSTVAEGTLRLTLSGEADAGLLELGTAKRITIDRAAQNGKATFAATANQRLRMRLGLGFPNNYGTYYSIIAPDGTYVARHWWASYLDFSLPTLSQTGTYTLVFDPTAGSVGTLDVTVYVPPTAAGASAETASAPVTPRQPDCAPVPSAARPGASAADRDPAEEVEEPGSALPYGCEEPDSLGWRPDALNLNGDGWSTRHDPAPVRERPLQFPLGFTGVAGKVLSTAGAPLAGVKVSVGDQQTSTDDQGRFVLTGVPSGHVAVRVDGRGAGDHGVFDIGVDLARGQVLVLPHTVFLPELDPAGTVRVASPTTSDVVLTTKAIPGLEVRIPKGTVVRDADGNVVTELNLTPIPIDRAPFPLPPTKVPVYFTVQPGGGTLFPEGATIVYPNYTKEPPGTRTQFWNYDPDGKGWHIYGQGTVSADGKQIVPDDDVKFYRLTGAMTAVPGMNPPPKAPIPGGQLGGDPVDLATGLLVDEAVDLVVDDIMPIEIKRTYQQGDPDVRPFGVGTNFDYGMFPWSPGQIGNFDFSQFDLIQPNGAKIHYHRVSPGSDYAGAVFRADPTPTEYDGSTVRWNGDGWDVELRDGRVIVLADEAPMQSIRDKFGNTTTITRAPAPPWTDGKVRLNGPITQITSPSGRWVKFTYDSGNPPRVAAIEDNLGRRVSYTYDSTGRLSTVTGPDGGVTRYTWENGLLKTITKPNGNRYLENEYDAEKRVKRQVEADGGVTTFDYTAVNGVITETRMTDPRGHVQRFTFNAKGRVLTDTRAFGTPLAQTLTHEYDTAGVRRVATVDALGRRTTYAYNDLGQVSETVTLAGTPEARTERFEYNGPHAELTKHTDIYGKTTVHEYDARGGPLGTTDRLGKRTAFETDLSGQITKTTDPAGKATTTEYIGGDAVRITDPLGRVTATAFDGIGRPVRTTDPRGAATDTTYTARDHIASVTDPLGRVTAYTYDDNGNRTKVRDPRGGETVFAYNSIDRVSSVTDPLGAVETFEYDLHGNAVKHTSRRGIVTTHTYDELDRRTRTEFGTEIAVDYGYDAANRTVRAEDSTSGVVSTEYDGLDRVTMSTTPHGTVSYSYSPTVRDRTMTVPGGTTVRHVYDAEQRLSAIERDGTVVSAVVRDDRGLATRVGAPGAGVHQTQSYDDAGRVTGITYRRDQQVLGELTYGRDAAGLPVSTGGSFSRGLLPEPFSGAYDAANRLTSVGSTAVAYDAEGHLTSDGVTTYTWNARGQLAGLSRPGVSAAFTYAAAGERLGRTVNGTTTHYLYDGPNPLQELVNGTVTATMTSSGIDGWHTRQAGGVERRVLTDALGSTVALVDASGAGAAYSYEPFGRTQVTGDDLGNPFRYTGREDDGTGLYHYRARYYSPVLQRFISEDPIGFAGGVNLHAYAANQPTHATDPDGKKPYVPGAYLVDKAFKAPKQTTPGTRTLTGEYINDRGPGGVRVEPWVAHYDQYGRLIGRTDYNAGLPKQGIPDVHHHKFEYGPGRQGGQETVKHAPGEYPG
ncbi:DNRLRE domain-containing protein [Actinokineospora sp. UTMC 2448]|uniref:DNRLRE domain-containing protein n=1 Tax=Actinokineospora sp. UTMC 2448 TaxID=2268449 RepID=UPI0021641DA8|nr:DNRLRE domain-containing protein [Actinokineospora sp. UTMC 2448]UVS79156.1 Cell wall-associated polypeptide [Actinokineospora sp. UTMC 2448]